jgi:hypothetical protein
MLKKYKHNKSNTIYHLICVTNEHATKDDWKVTAVYHDDNGNHWSRPLSDFLKSCSEI